MLKLHDWRETKLKKRRILSAELQFNKKGFRLEHQKPLQLNNLIGCGGPQRTQNSGNSLLVRYPSASRVRLIGRGAGKLKAAFFDPGVDPRCYVN